MSVHRSTSLPPPGMAAAVYRGAGEVRVEQVPTPVPGPGEALIRVRSCGICGTDLKKIAHNLVPPPRIFGHETAGTIAALGEGVEDWSVGDRVVLMHHVPCLECHYCARHDFAQCPQFKRTGTTAGFEPAGGGFAQYVLAMDWIVRRGMVRIPSAVSFEEAVFLEPLNTCLKAVRRAGLRSGDTVTILGQGPIGLLFTQLCRLEDAQVVAVDRLQYRLKKASALGAAAAVQPDGLLAATLGATQGRGADLVIVATADSSVIAEAFSAARPGGAVLLFAQTRQGDTVSIDAGEVCMREKRLVGSYSADITLQAETAALIFGRRIDVLGLVTHRFPLKDISEAIALAQRPQEGALKVMVCP